MNLVFCDLDGTLEDSRVDMARAVQGVRMHFDLDPREAEDWTGQVNRGMEALYRGCFSELFAQSGPPGSEGDFETLEKIQSAYEAEYYEHVAEHTKLYPGIQTALERLDEIATLALYTNKPQRHSRKLLIELGVSAHFSYIIGCDTFAVMKPAREPMAEIARHAEFDPAKDRAFMIGDTAGDMKAARAFNATAIWCAWGYNADPPADPAPDHRAERPEDLPGLIAAASA
ncbi:MAG: HAD-IA family hydrolase [Leptospirales bacterium]|jgi:phosphoglycolate phosphatase